MGMEQIERKDLPETAQRLSAYEPPRLVEYGSVAKLTQSAGATVEGGTGMQCL